MSALVVAHHPALPGRRSPGPVLFAALPEAGRQMRVSSMLARGAFAGMAGLIVLLVFFATGFFVKESEHMRADRLAEENERLEAQLSRLDGRLETLQETMEDLTRRDEQYRLMAGLEPLGDAVHAAGIGGPGTAARPGEHTSD